MISPAVPVHKIEWNGNDGEVWYADAGGPGTTCGRCSAATASTSERL
jgi:hypothetical protein